jgi:hypothetical protein
LSIGSANLSDFGPTALPLLLNSGRTRSHVATYIGNLSNVSATYKSQPHLSGPPPNLMKYHKQFDPAWVLDLWSWQVASLGVLEVEYLSISLTVLHILRTERMRSDGKHLLFGQFSAWFVGSNGSGWRDVGDGWF